MKKISQRSFVLFVSLTILFTTYWYVQACGPDYPEETPGIFNPVSIGKTEFSPFFRVMTDWYNGVAVDENGRVHDMDTLNIHAWYNFFKKKVAWSDLYETVYKYSTEEIDSLIFVNRDAKYSASKKILSNSILRYQDKKIVNDFLFYLGYAKRCEPYATANLNNYDYWDTVTSEWKYVRAIDSMAKEPALQLIENGKKQMKNARNTFIRERYQYQVCRMYFYLGLYQQCIEYYDSIIGNIKENYSLRYRLMSLAAGAYYLQKQYAKANYLSTVIFDQFPIWRNRTVSGFRPKEDADFEGSLQLAKNNHEKAILWFMLGYYDPARAMHNVYALEPKSELLDILLTRYIDMYEEEWFRNNGSYWDEWVDAQMIHIYNDSTETYSSIPKRFVINSIIPAEEMQFIMQTAKSGNTNRPYLWDIAAGYLSTIQRDFTSANDFFAGAAKKIPSNKFTKKQMQLFNFFLHAEAYQQRDEAAEKVLAKEWEVIKRDSVMYENSFSALVWVTGRLAEKFDAMGNYIYAECLRKGFDTSIYADAVKMDELINFKKKKNKSSFEELIAGISQYTVEDIYDYQGIQALRRENYQEAVEKFTLAMKNSNSSKKDKPKPEDDPAGYPEILTKADPFKISLLQRQPSEWQAMEGRTLYSKLTFAKEMALLYKKIEQKEGDVAGNCFLLAAAHFNMTYFGNSRELHQSAIFHYSQRDYTNSFWGTYSPKLPVFDCSPAKKYFRMALDLSGDREFKARCAFMLARCEQNDFYKGESIVEKGLFTSGTYFRVLREEYPDTKYFKELLQECKTFRDFAVRKY